MNGRFTDEQIALIKAVFAKTATGDIDLDFLFDEVQNLGIYTFLNMSGVTSVKVSNCDPVQNAFSGCANLTTVTCYTLPNGTWNLTALADVYVTNPSETAARCLQYFTRFLSAIPKTCKVHFVTEGKYVAYDTTASAWASYDEEQANGGGCRLTCARRSLRGSLRPSARFCAPSTRKEAA